MRRRTPKIFVTVLALFFLLVVLIVPSPNSLADSPQPPASGLNTLTDQNVDGGRLEPLYLEVVQTIEVADDDGTANSSDVTITSIELDNLGDAPATDLRRVEVLNGANDLKGTLDVTSGSYPLTVELSSFTVPDDGTATIKVKIKIGNKTTGGTLRLQTTIVQDEGSTTDIRKAVDDGAAETVSTNHAPLSFKVTKGGDVYANRSYHGQKFISGNADLAEKVNVSHPVEPGDVLSFNVDNPNQYNKSQKPYSPLAAGVVSTKPGITLGSSNKQNQATIALMGTVPVKATIENGPIKPGDLLTTSSKPGYAMVCKDRSKCSGAIIGKALKGLDAGKGKIKILLLN